MRRRSSLRPSSSWPAQAAAAARFPIEDRGDLRWFLGIAIERDLAARTLRLSQKLYISDTVAKYGDWLRAGYGRKFDSPMAEGTVLSAADSPV